MMQSDNNFECSCCMIIQYDLTNWDTNTLAEGVVLLTLVTLGCLAASNCQPGHHGVSAISNNLHGPGCC